MPQNDIKVVLTADNSQLINRLEQSGREVRNFSSTTQRTSSFATRAFSAISPSVLAVGVALTGVTAAVAAAQAAFRSGIKAIEDFNLSVASTSALIVSFQKQSDELSIQEQFQLAQRYSRDLNVQLEKVAATTLLSADQVRQINTEFIKGGQLIDAQNANQINSLRNISNALGVVLGDQLSIGQVQQEIGDLVQGQITANSSLGKILEGIVPNLREQLRIWNEQGVLVERVGESLRGFEPAAESLENSLTAVKSTLQSTVNEVLRGAMQPAYEDIVKLAQDLNRFIGEHKDEIITFVSEGYTQIKETLQDISNLWQTINRLPNPFTAPVRFAQDFLGDPQANLVAPRSESQIELQRYEKQREEINEVNNVFQQLKDNQVDGAKEISKEVIKLNQAWRETFDALTQTEATVGLTAIEKSLFDIGIRFDELRSKFRNLDIADIELIDETQIIETQQAIDNFINVQQAEIAKTIRDTNIAILESEKDSVEQRISEQQKYIDTLKTEYSSVVSEIESQIRGLADLQQGLTGARITFKDITQELQNKLLTPYEQYKQAQERLDEDLKNSADLTGQARIDALQQFQREARSAVELAGRANSAFLNQGQAVETALDQVAQAQRRIEEEYAKMIDAQNQQITASQVWAGSLQNSISAAGQGLQFLQNELAGVNEALDIQREVEIDIEPAIDRIQSLRDYIDRTLPDTIRKRVVLEVDDSELSSVSKRLAKPLLKDLDELTFELGDRR